MKIRKDRMAERRPDDLRAKILGELRRDPVDLIALTQALDDLTALAKRSWWKRLKSGL